jgi:hypothetical protein
MSMMQDREVTLLERLIRPYPFFLGVVLSFVVCCLAGLLASRHNFFEHFLRFHKRINLESAYFPTASQVRALARATLAPEKIAVVVGGNSILYGTGQLADELWTKELQALLGDRYQVINLATPSAEPQEFGAVVAEMLAAEYPKLILIADVGSSTGPGTPDGTKYRYFFWDAYTKGLIPADEARDQLLAELAGQRAGDEVFAELQRRVALDRFAYAQDLWHTVAYTHFSTVWNWPVRHCCTKPRKLYAEYELPTEPLDRRYKPELHDYSMQVLREVIAPDPAGRAAEIAQHARECFPERFRPRTLFIVHRDSPYYLRQLTAAEQARYDAVHPPIAAALEQAGFAAVQVGAGYSDEDYSDRAHLSPQGGRRLAGEVAPKIEGIAKQLGFTE